MNDKASLKLNKREKGCFVLLFSIILLGFIDVAFVPLGDTHQGPASKAMFQSRTIGLALFQYSADHDGKYPEGKSSTEVFQKLGAYISDPNVFYLPMPGKIRSYSTTDKLKPENVCWDVTCCLDSQSPDQVPVVFLTGYRVSYKAGASATPLKKGPITFDDTIRSWSDWWHGIYYPIGYTAVTWKGNNSSAIKASPDGTIPSFIPADFDPRGKTYHQLTPDGELPP